MSKHSRSQILINSQLGEVRVALLEGEVVQEVHIQRSNESSIVGNIYRAVVTRVMPGLQAAFVDFGSERNGFLHIDDNYGMKPYVIKALDKLFPDKKMTEIQLSHPIYNNVYPFPKGLPKIHEHDGLAPKALGYFHESKLILLFTYESDLGDGWEDENIHNDPEEVRLIALKMGANIIKYAFEN